MDEDTDIFKLLSDIIKNDKDSNTLLNLTTTLWIILFVVIISQKVFKYVVKPCIRRNNNTDTNNTNQENANRDPSVECLIV